MKVGPPAVSHYHQTNRFFPTEDTPNLPDHDFPNPSYLLIPSGYMQLLLSGSDTCKFLEHSEQDITSFTSDIQQDTEQICLNR